MPKGAFLGVATVGLAAALGVISAAMSVLELLAVPEHCLFD